MPAAVVGPSPRGTCRCDADPLQAACHARQTHSPAAFADLLPDRINRRRKMGFGVPLAGWLRNELGPLVRQTLLDPIAQRRGYFRPAEVARLIDEHQSGKRDYSYRLWALLILELWHRQWVDGAMPP